MSLNELEKGLCGELQVKTYLDVLLPNAKYVYDISLNKRYNPEKLTQIDFLLFSEYGFYCLEVKAWSGEITVINDMNISIRTNRKMFYKSNPILQNRAHINTLKNYTSYTFKPLIVFTDEARIYGFKNEACSLSSLKYIVEDGRKRYTQEDIDNAYEYFNSIKLQNTICALGRHLEQVQSVREKGNRK